MFEQPSQQLSEPQSTLRHCGGAGLAILAVVMLCGASGVSAQVPSSATQAAPAAQSVASAVPNAQATSSRVPTDAQQSGEVPQALHLLVGRSLVITSPSRIKRVSLADPAIAEAIVVSPTQVLVNGRAPGGVSLIIWDENEQSQAFEVSVDIDVLSLTEKIHEVFPAEPVVVETSKDVVMLSGKISSQAVADKILEVVKGTTPKVTSLMEVPASPPGEILLEVKFAEVDKTALQQLGINILSLPGAKNVGTISTQQFSPPQLIGGSSSSSGSGSSGGVSSAIGVSNLLNIFFFRPDINLALTIQALQQNNVLEILAEPNLLTASGKDASFLAGGEFPFPIVQGTTGGGFAGITIQFKEFGVRLNFTPTLLPNGLIHLHVKPEVSALDFTNALTISGFTIPALSTRRVESEMDLRDGQSFAIAGLVDNRDTENLSKIPFIGDIPILGKLFTSRSIDKTRAELLVMVTPRIVHPIGVEEKKPELFFPKTFLGPTGPAASDQPKTPGQK